MNDNNNYNYYDSSVSNSPRVVQSVMSKTFLFMFLALLLSAGSALWTIATGFYIQVFTNDVFFYGLIIGELVIVMISNSVIRRNLVLPASLLFITFSLVNGITLSSILFIYTLESVFTTFLIAAAIFGVMAVYGFVTKKDLTTIGNIGMMGLTGIIVLGLGNIFLFKNDLLSLAVAAVGLAIFIGLTAYDTQKIKEMARNNYEISTNTLAIYGAFMLYLDFINIFLKLLRLFGKKR